MSETSPGCTHEVIEFAPELVDIPDAAHPFMYAAIRLRCAACHVALHWVGVPSGNPNSVEPTVTADGYELRAPVAAGPGAVVGLLEATGMGDHLVSPFTQTNGAQLDGR